MFLGFEIISVPNMVPGELKLGLGTRRVESLGFLKKFQGVIRSAQCLACNDQVRYRPERKRIQLKGRFKRLDCRVKLAEIHLYLSQHLISFGKIRVELKSLLNLD